MSPKLKQLLLNPYHWCATLFIDPLRLFAAWRALPEFLVNFLTYNRLAEKKSGLKALLRRVRFTTYDKYLSAGSMHNHYFWQDLWAARLVVESGVRLHVDVGSRIDGFVAHLLPYCAVNYVDIRPMNTEIEGLRFIKGSILEMPFANDSVRSLSCLHVIEHIGLGRYGDPLDPLGSCKAALELQRVLEPGGQFILGTPVGREMVCFDAHRIFSPATILAMFPELVLEQFSLIDDSSQGILRDASFDTAAKCDYGCGLFVFRKPLRL